MEKVRLGFVPSQRDVFDRKWARDMRARVMKAFEEIEEIEIIAPDTGVTKDGLVASDKDSDKVLSLFQKKGIDGIIIGTMTFGNEIPAISIPARMPGLPVLLFGTKEGPFTLDRNRLSDSFCGTLSIASGLYRRKRPFVFLGICFPEEDLFKEKIRNFASTVKAVKSFVGAKIGVIGARPEPFETCAINEIPLIERFGQRLIQVPLPDVFAAARNLKDSDPAVKKSLSEIYKCANCSAVTRPALLRAVKLEIALTNIARERGMSGMGVECWPSMQSDYKIAACLTLARLTEKGIMAACETDVHGALTMVIQYNATFRSTVPHFIDWTIQHQTMDDVFLAWHCGNAPMCLAGRNSCVKVMPHSIITRLQSTETSQSTVEFELDPGTVTLIRLEEYDGKFKMLITTGELISTGDSFRGAGGWVKVENLEKLYRTLVEEGFVHHASMIHGDLTAPLTDFCKLLGIQPIVV